MQRRNNVRRIRESRLLGKTELARLAGLSPLTIDRIEKGKSCHLQTQRKIILACLIFDEHPSFGCRLLARSSTENTGNLCSIFDLDSDHQSGFRRILGKKKPAV